MSAVFDGDCRCTSNQEDRFHLRFTQMETYMYSIFDENIFI